MTELEYDPKPRVAQPTASPARSVRRRDKRRATSLFAHGEPMVWLTGGALGLALAMISTLLFVVISRGLPTFWPQPVVEIATHDGQRFAGEVALSESFVIGPEALAALPADAAARARAALETSGGEIDRRMLRSGNYDLTGTHFRWVSDFEVAAESTPEWMLCVERLEWGRFYGVPTALEFDGRRSEGPSAQLWAEFERAHAQARATWSERRSIEEHDIGRLAKAKEEARLAVRSAELEYGLQSPQRAAAEREATALSAELDEEMRALGERIEELKALNAGRRLLVRTADGAEATLPLEQVVRAYPANQLSTFDKLAVYASRVEEFLLDSPRESNSEGGVFPAIFGTVLMTLIMSVLVVPFGVLAALYLREYARPGPLVSAVRIAINNLAGVPSIVFGVFGVGFFCYTVGGGIDTWLFPERLPSPTFGTGGLLWASLTLALLTLPVVIVPTEEALAAVPRSMREGSYACGATKWQTIWRIVLPRAMPGIMTGAILALARGAGEVAPLMLVGASKLAEELPIDGAFPYLHPERSFMHLGFHIYDLGFQSQNSEAAKPMVYTTTLLLIALVVVLNVVAIWIRARLRRRFQGAQL